MRSILPTGPREEQGVPTPNVALTTQTMLYGAAKAVENAGQLDLPAFFDLCAVIEACVILDGVQTIVSSDERPNFLLLGRLKDEGILGEFQPQLSRDEINRALLRLPAEFLDRMIPVDQGEQPEIGRGNTVAPSGAMRGVDYSIALSVLLGQIDSMADYPSLEDTTARTRVHRSNGYLFTAAVHGMDYFPDFDRAPFVSAQLRKLYRSLPLELYRRVAESFDVPLGQADTVAEWTLDATLPIPPVAAIVLSRARSVAEIPEQILQVREEFAGYRRTFAKFKTELRDVETVKQRNRLARRYGALLEAASGPRPELVTMAETLNFAQHTVKAAAAPLVPTSYSGSLITQPVEWVRRWWLNRPLTILFRMDGKLPRLTEYNTLIETLWGNAIEAAVIERYTAHALEIRRLMSDSAHS
jgi:hypothetical protein